MKTICYYISDYGYGHATRSIAIIRALTLYTPNRYHIIIRSGNALGFIRDSLRDLDMINLDFRECASDLGYILKKDSILQEEVDLVISDISPVPICSAKLANVKSMGISNFMWYTAYQQLIDQEFLKPLYDAFIHLSGSIEPRWGSENVLKLVI